MAQPNTLQGHKFRVYVSDGTSGDGRFNFLCVAEQKQFEQAVNFEEKYLPDCSDPSALPQRQSQPTGSRWDVKIDGVLDPDSTAFKDLDEAFEGRVKVEIKILQDRTGAKAYTGFVWVESLQQTANGAGATSFSAQLRGDGALTVAAVA